ncbi:MAG: helix-turn-helix transcriptional regulator [Clostridia bacterium]|nr:helix-turn-helix transcriptional regulator [Clostridia bacterium]
MIDTRVVGRSIAFLRRQQRMTQQGLASVMNVSHQAVSKWENGVALPDIQTVLSMSRLFGVSMEALLTGTVLESA